MFLAPNFLSRSIRKLLHLYYKIQQIFNYVANFHSDWPRDVGERWRKKHKPPPVAPNNHSGGLTSLIQIRLYIYNANIFYSVLFSTVTAFLSRKIRQWHFIQRSIFRYAFCPVALCPEFECHVSIDHQCAVQFEIGAISIVNDVCLTNSPEVFSMTGRVAADKWLGPGIHSLSYIMQSPFDRAVRAPMLTGFPEAFGPLPIVKDSTRDWCQIHRLSTVVHKRTGAEMMARPVYTVSGKKVYGFLGITSANTIRFSNFSLSQSP